MEQLIFSLLYVEEIGYVPDGNVQCSKELKWTKCYCLSLKQLS